MARFNVIRKILTSWTGSVARYAASVSASFGLKSFCKSLLRSPWGRRKVYNSRDWAKYFSETISFKKRSRKYLRSLTTASSFLPVVVFLGTGGT